MVGFTEEILSLKPAIDDENWFSFDAVIDGPANVCGTGAFLFTSTSVATVVVVTETAIRFFSVPGFS